MIRNPYDRVVWSDLSIKHLLALRAVAEEGTFGRAGERLGFTQSAVSQQIATLEGFVGHSLFERPAGPSRPKLTPAGRLLLEHATTLLDRVEEAERDLDRFSRGVSGRLNVATFQSVSARVLPATLQQFYGQAPDAEVSLVDLDVQLDPLDALVRDGEIDLAFAIGEIDDRFSSVSLGADPHIAIVPVDYPSGAVDLHSLSGSPMVGQPAEDSCGLMVDRQLERLGITANYAFRSHDNGAVQGMVGAGLGIAIMPLLTADTRHAGTSIRTTVPELEPRQLSILWDRHRPLSPLAQRFVDIVTQVCADLLAHLTDHAPTPA